MIICLERGTNAYGPADATARPSSLALVKFRMVYLSGAGSSSSSSSSSSRPGVQSASLYDNFRKPGNYVIMTSLMTS